MILSCRIFPSHSGQTEILKNVSFHIEANEKAAIVGINGAGKSTLLKIIMQETPDTGEVILAKDATIGYLAQYQDVSDTGPSTRRFLTQSRTSSRWRSASVEWRRR